MSPPPELTPESPSASAPAKRDRFVPLMVAIAVLGLVGIGVAIYFYFHTAATKEVSESYLTLPEMIIDSDTQLVRIKVAVEVNATDHEWLQKNNVKINQIFKESIQNVDTDDFRNRAGCEAIQIQLKDDFNKQLNVDKIQAVLYQDLLMQSK